jgi:general secretion pathway protein D
MTKPELKLHQKALLSVLACSAFPALPAFAGPTTYSGGYTGGSSSIVEIEYVKRQERMRQAYELERDGDRLYAKQDYAGAVDAYRSALTTLPHGTTTQGDRSRIAGKFSRAAVIHARELGHRGRREEAKTLLNEVLSDNISPGYKDAERLLEQLDDPDRFNVAMTPQHYTNTEEVKRLLNKGLGYYDLGQFNEAEVEFNRVLAIDPYNTAARRQLERTQIQVSNYLKSARDETRLRMLNMVDATWATAVPNTLKAPITTGGPGLDDPGSAPLTNKLNNISIDRISFNEADLQDVIDHLRRKSAENDMAEADPNKRGVNFLNRVPAGQGRPVTVDMRNVKLMDAVKTVADQAGVRFDVQPTSVVFIPAGVAGSMTTRTYRVPPDFLTRGSATGDAGGAAAPADPFATPDAGASTNTVASRPNAKQVLESLGVTFTEGSSASFDRTSSRLIVRNTFDQLDLVETVVDQINQSGTVKQVYVTTKFVEVTQRNNEELGFDWLIGAFNIGGDRVFGAGGTSGNTGPIDAADFSVVSPGGVPVGSNPVTRGLRFGSDAISQNAIDALIAGGTAAGVSSVTPGVFALAGVFTDPQFQVMMRALSQKKGVDLMTAPSVIVRGGQRSKIEVIREFPYPTEFDPPQIPQTFGGGGGGLFGGGGIASQGSSFPVTPTTPSAFSTKNTGVTMEVEATVGEDGWTIDLNLAPEVVEFDGFINYGSPIQTTGINALGQNEPVVLTDNKILQPVFATRKLTTQVLIYDRQTVGIGGLMREDVQHVEDKVPIISSIPLVGRLFKTKNEEHYKRNLMIYVTAQLIDPSGQPVHQERVTETVVEEGPSSPILPPVEGIPVDMGK